MLYNEIFFYNIKKCNLLWNKCYDSIRLFYKNIGIYIIDDNSSYTPKRLGIKLINTTIINSEFLERGELLPYYYFYNSTELLNFSKEKLFTITVYALEVCRLLI
uniref:Uncharacterized protein n=1 Tax=viral metagenome TaxID=1070528 RepID=A0A6C0EKQ8_9ZZZZ